MKDIGLDNDDQQQLEKHKLFFYGYLDSLGIKNRIIKRKLYRVHNRYTWNHHEEEPEAKQDNSTDPGKSPQQSSETSFDRDDGNAEAKSEWDE